MSLLATPNRPLGAGSALPSGGQSGGGIARAAGTVMAAFVVSRALGLAREIVISNRFGTSGELDAYLAAFRIPDLLFQLMAGGALASAFIPTFAGLLAADDEQAAWRLGNSVMNALALGMGVVTLACLVLAGPLTRHVVAAGFDPERQELTARLMRIMLLAPVAFSVSGVFMGVLNSYGRFLAPALAPSAYNLAIIIGAAFLSPEIGAYGLALGVAVGSVAHYVIQLPQVLALMPEELEPGPGEHGFLGLRSPQVREVVRLMIPRSVGLAAVQVNFLVNTILATSLAPGSLATLNYAWMLMLLPQGIFAQGVATAAFPALSALAAQKRWDDLAGLFLRSTRGVVFLALPATVGLMVLGEPIVTLVLGRGAFDSQAATAVSRVLLFYALGLSSHSVLEVVTRAFYATHDPRSGGRGRGGHGRERCPQPGAHGALPGKRPGTGQHHRRHRGGCGPVVHAAPSAAGGRTGPAAGRGSAHPGGGGVDGGYSAAAAGNAALVHAGGGAGGHGGGRRRVRRGDSGAGRAGSEGGGGAGEEATQPGTVRLTVVSSPVRE